MDGSKGGVEMLRIPCRTRLSLPVVIGEKSLDLVNTGDAFLEQTPYRRVSTAG
eukprot:m.771770 g.771770  ORF g.771770 m.771770 type:complete len:53 (+) comp59095_c1_seq10:2-160(+)